MLFRSGAKYTQDEKIYFEKDIALQTAKTLKNVLEQNGAKVFMSREEDKYLSSKEQALFANKQNPHVIISLHTNKAKDKDISGVELWGINLAMWICCKRSMTYLVLIQNFRYEVRA